MGVGYVNGSRIRKRRLFLNAKLFAHANSRLLTVLIERRGGTVKGGEARACESNLHVPPHSAGAGKAVGNNPNRTTSLIIRIII